MRQDICLCAMHGLVIFFSFIPIGFNCFMSIRFIKSVLKTTWKNKISISEWKGTGLFQSLYTNKYDNLVENIFPTWTTRLIFHISCFLFYKKNKCQFKFVFYFGTSIHYCKRSNAFQPVLNKKNRSIVLAPDVYFRQFPCFCLFDWMKQWNIS